MKNNLASARLSFRKQVILQNQRPIKEEVFQFVTKSKLEGFDSKLHGETSSRAFAEKVCIAVNNFDALLEACKRALPWIGKMIADEAHLNSVLPNDCVQTMKLLEHVIANAEK